MRKLEYLSTGLSVVLIFIGLKMLLQDIIHTPIIVSLGVVVLILGGAVVASMLKRRKSEKRLQEEPGARGQENNEG
jgi:tellurite resistance protein TerC